MSGKSSRQYKGEAREAYWRERIAAFEASGLTLEAFCRQEGNSSSAMRLWRRRLGAGNGVQTASTAQAPVIVTVPSPVVAAAMGPGEPPDACFQGSPRPRQPQPPFANGPFLRLHVGERYQVDIAGDFAAPVLGKLLAVLEGRS